MYSRAFDAAAGVGERGKKVGRREEQRSKRKRQLDDEKGEQVLSSFLMAGSHHMYNKPRIPQERAAMPR